ncbi:MAG TPA: CaiB/BaiF CoA-transferase family protein [Acidimicrobiales bacterium]|nr:CaiB/BaiF CoA-transferase family protein [Acidimicrobiales bacterium]
MADGPLLEPVVEPPAAGPLRGITVVDLSRVLAGPYCTMVLADLGARVIKVERPGRGDDARHMGPFVDGRSAYFASVNRAKESIALDLADAADRQVFEQLLEGADVLVENFRPGVLDRLGYGWEKVAARWPRLVVASVSGFGHTGPYADRPSYDMIAQAMGGIMSITGHSGAEPVRVGTSIGDLAAALFCAVGILGALHERHASGVGRHVDVSLLDCQVALLENAIARYSATGVVPGPLGARHPAITPFGLFRAGGGTRLVIAAGNDDLFGRLCQALDQPSLATDARFRSNELRCRHHRDLEEVLEAALAARPADEWLVVLGAAGVPCSPINDVAAVVGDPQVAARNMVISLAGGELPGLQVAGNPIKLSGVADPTRRPGAPALDADRAAILAELAGGGSSHQPEGLP